MKKPILWVMLFLSIAIIVIYSCKKEEQNLAPIIDSIIHAPSDIDFGDTCTITVTASDPNNDELTYTWSFTAGELLTGAGTNVIEWIAPATAENCIISVEISDGEFFVSGSDTLYPSAHPTISVDTDILNFGEETESLSFKIVNEGTGNLEWSVSEDASWIVNVEPSTGSTQSENTVTVTVDRSGLTVGNHSANLSIESNGGNSTIQVQISKVDPVLQVSPNSLDFGYNYDSRQISISNDAPSSELSWSIIPNDSWVSLSPGSGTTTSETDQVYVNVDRSGLAPGDYDGELLVTSNGGEKTVDLTMVVRDPVLNVSTNTLDFGTETDQLSFSISNAAPPAELTWNISSSESWITSIDPISGSSTTESDAVTVTIDRSGLSEGDYTDEIIVSSNGGDETINVSMTVEPAPECDFWEDYSGGEENWTYSNVSHSIVSGVQHLTATSSSYIGYAMHDFTSTMNLPWSYSADLKVVSCTGEDRPVAIYTKINDAGTYYISSMYFAVVVNSTEGINWIWMWYIPTLGGWGYYNSSCYGYSSGVNTSGGWNELVVQANTNETFTYTCNGSTLLSSNNSINAFESQVGVDVTLGVEYIRLWIYPTCDSEWDNICFNSESSKIYTPGIQNNYPEPPTAEETIKMIKDIRSGKLKSFEEMMK